MTQSRFVIVALAVGAIGFVSPAAEPLGAQELPVDDVVLLGQRYGVRPPASYFELKARNPDAFTFSRAWKARNPRLQRLVTPTLDGRPRFDVLPAPRGATSSSGFDGALALGPRDAPVEGTIRVPLVLGLFQDSPLTPPYSRDELQEHLFSDHPGSILSFYDEVSGGRLELLGETMEWKRSSLTEAQVTADVSALPGQIGPYIMGLLNQNSGADWGRYDNDGPDGIPNSGDDDGYVDILAVMHPNFGAECSASGRDDRIWSHKWSLKSAVNQYYVTDVAAVGHGRNIRVNDYTVQPAISCDRSSIVDIGVLAHELGHGLGLPDLYGTTVSSPHAGAGGWDLMGSGSYGCAQRTPHLPCHMGAWTKEQLGWVDVVTIGPDVEAGTVTLPPVEQSGTVYRIDAQDGSGEYFLLENRQRIGFDGDLLEPGLLVWHVDDALVLERWSTNKVNVDGAHMGVHLRQADGRNDLGIVGGNRGDVGDPFPGSLGRRSFHAGSSPASSLWSGAYSGLTVTDIALSGQTITAGLLTGLHTITLETSGAGGASGGFAVDGQAVGTSSEVTAAPFQLLEIEAGAGVEIEDGRRVGFLGWSDDGNLGRIRTFEMPAQDVSLTASYGGEEVRARLTIEGEQFGVPPGTVDVTPAGSVETDGIWFQRGTDVSFEATPKTGYGFGGWTGALAGMDNPAALTVDAPLDIGILFELIYGVPGASHAFVAATQQDIVLVAENATTPVTWTAIGGVLPDGLTLQGSGRIVGAALETGTFTLNLRARDAHGLQAEGGIVLEVSEPELGLDALGAPFLFTSGSLTSLEQDFLDAQGNANGTYDLGDFRAWVLAHPDLPASAQARAPGQTTYVPVIRFQPGGGQ